MELTKIEDLTDEQKGRLTEDDIAELTLLLEAGEAREEADETRLDELEAKANGKVDEVNTEEPANADDTPVVDAETNNEPEPEPEPVIDEEVVIIPQEYEDGSMVNRTYTVEKVDGETPAGNRLWGVYYSEQSTGLACSTKCFVLDVSKELKANDIIELPETAVIRQSQRKIKQGDTNTKPSTFDWLHF